MLESVQSFLQNNVVSIGILLATVITSIRAFRDPLLKDKFILHPWSFVREKNYFTLITSGLIHADYMHLGFNMVAFYLYSFDQSRIEGLEYQMVYQQVIDAVGHGYPEWLPVAIGHLKFFLLYFICMVAADLTTIWRFRDRVEYRALGASGAVSGIVFGYLVFNPAIRILGMNGWVIGIGYLAASSIASRYRSGNVNHDAHFWGGLAGVVFTFLLFPPKFMIAVEYLKDFFERVF